MTEVIKVKGLRGLLTRLKKDLGKDFPKKITTAVRKAAIDTSRTVVKNVPVAHGEIRKGIDVLMQNYVRGGKVRRATSGTVAWIVCTAPHAAPVEVGSRPHMPPLAPIRAWVALRGMQGLDKRGIVRASKAAGTTTAFHSMTIASQLRAMRVFSATDRATMNRRMKSEYRRALKQTGENRLVTHGFNGARIASTAVKYKLARMASKMGTTPVNAADKLAWAIAMGIKKHGTKPHWYMRNSLPAAEANVRARIRAALRRPLGN